MNGLATTDPALADRWSDKSRFGLATSDASTLLVAKWGCMRAALGNTETLAAFPAGLESTGSAEAQVASEVVVKAQLLCRV